MDLNWRNYSQKLRYSRICISNFTWFVLNINTPMILYNNNKTYLDGCSFKALWCSFKALWCSFKASRLWLSFMGFEKVGQWSLESSFCVSNGVRQGRTLYPILFNVYLDDLILLLLNLWLLVILWCFCKPSCLCRWYGFTCPFTLSTTKPMDHCVKFVEVNDVFYNAKKAKCMCVRPMGIKNLYFPKIFF